MADEEKLLDLAKALVLALEPDARQSFADKASLASFLSETSAHL